MTDYIWAIIHAIVKAFYDFDFIEYINRVFSGHLPPPIGLCTANVTHAVARKLSSLTNGRGAAKDARTEPLHWLASLKLTVDLTEAEELFEVAVLVFDSEWDCVHDQKAENNMMNIIVNLGRMHLRTKFSQKTKQKATQETRLLTMTVGLNTTSSPRAGKRSLNQPQRCIQSPFYALFRKTMDKARCSCPSTREKNKFYIKRFIDHFLKTYLAYYPLWSMYTISNILPHKKQHLSNWPAENHFRNTKQYVLQRKCITPADTENGVLFFGDPHPAQVQCGRNCCEVPQA